MNINLLIYGIFTSLNISRYEILEIEDSDICVIKCVIIHSKSQLFKIDSYISRFDFIRSTIYEFNDNVAVLNVIFDTDKINNVEFKVNLK